MFKDRQKELARLEAELLQEEQPEEEIPEEETEICRNHANSYKKVRAYNTDITDEDLDRFSEEVRKPKKRTDILVLCAIAMCLIAGIIGVLCWLAERFLGR